MARHIALIVCTLMVQVTAVRGGEFGPLLAKMPDSVNALILINADELFESEYGKQQNWRGNYAQRFDSSPSMLPPTTDQFVWGAEMLLETMSPDTQYAAMNLNRDLSMPQLARWIRGSMNTIGGMEAVATPRGGIVIKFSPVEYGIVLPASRQKASRWVQSTKGSTENSLSPYLNSVVSDAKRTDAHICQVIDLTDSVDRQAVRAALVNSKVVQQQGLDVDRVADLLASVRGVNVLVSFTDQPYGTLIVDFGGDTAPLKNSGKDLLIEVLNEAGTSLSELPNWSATTDPHRIVLEGPMSESGLMRVFSFLEIDTSVVNDQLPPDIPADTGTKEKEEERYADDPATITRNYYQSVQKYLKDLSRERGAKSYYSIAVWYDKYAKRIERLPILNVDPEVLDYGESVIGHLRAAADSIQGGGVKTAARGAQITPGSDYGYGYGNGYRVFSGANYAASQVANVEAERRAIRAQEKAQSTLDAKGHLAAIENETLQIRRRMTEKYGVEF